MELSRFCTQKLEETERRVTILMKDGGGNVVEKPFAPARTRTPPVETMFDLPAYLERNSARIDQALDGFLPAAATGPRPPARGHAL